MPIAFVEHAHGAVERGDIDHLAAHGQPTAIFAVRYHELPPYLHVASVNRIDGRVRDSSRVDLQYLDPPGELPSREVLGRLGRTYVGVHEPLGVVICGGED